MNQIRRQTLQAGGSAGLLAVLVAAGLVRPGEARAADWNEAAFTQKSLGDALKALNAGGAAVSGAVQIRAPEIAENGAVVPIAIDSKLPGTQWIALLIEKNPQPLAASFDIPAGTEPAISTRVKMGQSSDVIALVKADGKFYTAKKEIKITLGGCGG